MKIILPLFILIIANGINSQYILAMGDDEIDSSSEADADDESSGDEGIHLKPFSAYLKNHIVYIVW